MKEKYLEADKAASERTVSGVIFTVLLGLFFMLIVLPVLAFWRDFKKDGISPVKECKTV